MQHQCWTQASAAWASLRLPAPAYRELRLCQPLVREVALLSSPRTVRGRAVCSDAIPRHPQARGLCSGTNKVRQVLQLSPFSPHVHDASCTVRGGAATTHRRYWRRDYRDALEDQRPRRVTQRLWRVQQSPATEAGGSAAAVLPQSSTAYVECHVRPPRSQQVRQPCRPHLDVAQPRDAALA